jgi:hypothetical protein
MAVKLPRIFFWSRVRQHDKTEIESGQDVDVSTRLRGTQRGQYQRTQERDIVKGVRICTDHLTPSLLD